ncbi:phospholipase A1-like [Culicoides brevitarsis]|uniref:phospholipase A1-like n=1 Tax=Culicoides brevitarsis TaxID=469753 RepID=UPI00307C89F4
MNKDNARRRQNQKFRATAGWEIILFKRQHDARMDKHTIITESVVEYSPIFYLTNAKKKQKVASLEELGLYLFNATNTTYLEDFEKGIPLIPVRAGEDFDLQKDVKFGFLSKNHPNREIFTYEEREFIPSKADFVSKKPLRVIIHGWKNDGNSPMIQTITEAYLNTSEVTLMVVDWSRLASENYLVARELINDVANVTAHMIKFLLDENLVDLKEIYLVGHSLGAHTAGLTGKDLQKLTGKKVPAIMALDPAGPLFSQEHKERRLDKSDAERVVVLHTSTLLGYTEPLGHADYYANFGFSQPGCGFDLMRHCAHSRAYMYLAEAILDHPNEPFWALKCEANVEDLEEEKCEGGKIEARFDENALRKPMEGIFVFMTNSEAPWARNRRELRVLNEGRSSGNRVEIGYKVAVFSLLFAKFFMNFV